MTKVLTGLKISAGTAVGAPFIISGISFETGGDEITPADKSGEIAAFEESLKKAGRQIEDLQKAGGKGLGKDESSIFTAHALMLADPMLTDGIRDLIDKGSSARDAVIIKVTEIKGIFESLSDPYLRERASDVEDVGRRILKCLLGIGDMSDIPSGRDIVLFADELTPSETASIPAERIVGIVTRKGGFTGHWAIIARSLGIPAISGIDWPDGISGISEEVIVDGDEGKLILGPGPEILSEYRKKTASRRDKTVSSETVVRTPSTKDGTEIELWGNIASAESAETALAMGCTGIGLFRTEFLFMDRSIPPTEEEQVESYSAVLRRMRPHPVVARTLDAGGDKEISYLKELIGHEDNPFLGLRGLRLCLREPSLLKTQFRALLRSAAYGRLRIMLPMATSIDELREAKKLLSECADDLREEGTSFSMPEMVGIMIEVPSAAVMAGELAKEADFFSIGTNDLTQYTLACDRLNTNIGYLYDHFHPANLRMIAMAAEAAAGEGIGLGICGEMGGDELAVPFLLGCGFRELSMTPALVPAVRKRIGLTDINDAKRIYREAIEMASAAEVRNLLEKPESGPA